MSCLRQHHQRLRQHRQSAFLQRRRPRPGDRQPQGSSIATGGYIVQTNVNLGSVLTSGIDLQLAYTAGPAAGFGNVHFDMNGTWLQHSHHHGDSGRSQL